MRFGKIQPSLIILFALGMQFAAESVFAANNSVTAQISASRTSGKAPLLVFFDATATTDSDTPKPVNHVNYDFDCGDGNTAEYNLAGHKTTKRCTFSGSPLFAYVYESPGTYTASVTASSQDGDSSTATVTITVSGWSAGETRCVSTGGTFTGCPSGAAQVISSDLDQAIGTALAAGDKRVLFRAGESFAVNTTVNLDGGMHIGSYGDSGIGDGKFIVTGTPSLLWGAAGPADNDIRLTDGSYTGGTSVQFLDIRNASGGGSQNILVQNWDISTVKFVLIEMAVANSVANLPSNIGFFSVNATDCGNTGSQCLFTGIRRFAVVDSIFKDSTGGEHVFRAVHSSLTFIHNSRFEDPANLKSTIVVRGCDWNGADCGFSNVWSEFFFMSDSHIVADTDWSITIGESNASTRDARHRNHILERNYFTAKNDTDLTQLFINMIVDNVLEDLTIRNNLFDMTNSETFASAVGGGGVNIEILNNSMYSPGNSRDFMANGLNGSAKCYNNLAWDESGSQDMNFGSCDSQANADANGAESGVSNLSVCPFAQCPPSSPQGFKLEAGNLNGLVDAGIDTHNLFDFGSNSRPGGLSLDVGAWEEVSSMQPPTGARVTQITP